MNRLLSKIQTIKTGILDSRHGCRSENHHRVIVTQCTETCQLKTGGLTRLTHEKADKHDKIVASCYEQRLVCLPIA